MLCVTRRGDNIVWSPLLKYVRNQNVLILKNNNIIYYALQNYWIDFDKIMFNVRDLVQL